MGQDLISGSPTIALNQQNAETAHNEAIHRASAIAGRTVSAVNQTTLPANPTAPTVILLGNATSLTSPPDPITYSYPYHIAYFAIQKASPGVSDWIFIAPRTNMVFVNTANTKEYRFDGTNWVAMTRTIS